MRKKLMVLALAIAVCLVMASCENGLPEGLLKIMGGMGSNLMGVDASKVEEVVEKAKVNTAEADAEGNIKLGEYTVKITGSEFGSELSLTIGDKNVTLPMSEDLTAIESFISPSESLSEIVSALESNAGEQIAEQLQEKVTGAEKDAVEGTVKLLNAALSAVNDSGLDDNTQTLLDTLQDTLTEPEGGYTKADALVLQALTNVVFAAATEIDDSVVPSELIGSLNDPFFELKSISDNSGSNIKLDFEQLMSLIQQ